MRQIFVTILLVYLFLAIGSAFSEEVEINSSIVSVNYEFKFFIIDSGEVDGIEVGDGLIVYRNKEKIAEACIIEVRPEVSAAEILRVEKDKKLQEGDPILIAKEKKVTIPPRQKKEKAHVVPSSASKDRKAQTIQKKSKWTPIRTTSETLVAQTTEKTSSKKMPKVQRKYRWTPTGPTSETTTTQATGQTNFIVTKQDTNKEADSIAIDISRDFSAVFSYAETVLKENGWTVTSSNRTAGIILAIKPIELSVIKELWADATQSIGHKLVVSIDVKESGGASRLFIYPFKEHYQRNRYIKDNVTKDSKYYTEIVNLVTKIRRRSED